MSDLTCRVMLLFLKLCTSSPKGALKTFCWAISQKKHAKNPLQPTIGARTPVRIFWCRLKVESEARRCGTGRFHARRHAHTPVDGTHPMHTQAHVCVCSDSLNNNVLLPYWSSGYFFYISTTSSCTFRENPLLLKISAAPQNSSLLTKTTSTLPRLIFQAGQDGIGKRWQWVSWM